MVTNFIVTFYSQFEAVLWLYAMFDHVHTENINLWTFDCNAGMQVYLMIQNTLKTSQ